MCALQGKMANSCLAAWSTKARCGTVETVEHLNLSEFWNDRLDRRTRVELAAIHQDHRGG
jgi:hypothetical protein